MNNELFFMSEVVRKLAESGDFYIRSAVYRNEKDDLDTALTIRHDKTNQWGQGTYIIEEAEGKKFDLTKLPDEVKITGKLEYAVLSVRGRMKFGSITIDSKQKTVLDDDGILTEEEKMAIKKLDYKIHKLNSTEDSSI